MSEKGKARHKRYNEKNRERLRPYVREKAKKYRAKHPECTRDTWDKWDRNHPLASLLSKVKGRAKTKGILFTLTTKDLVIPTTCPILGITLSRIAVNGRSGNYPDNYPELDRIIPEKGYIPSNVRFVSRRANRIKNNGTALEHRQIAEYIERESA